MSEELKRFGIRLKELRNEKHLTQAELGTIMGCIDRNVQKMEYGRNNVPANHLVQLASFFGVSLEYLTGRSEDRTAALEGAEMDRSLDLQLFAQRLKTLRKEKGLTQKKMAEMIGRTERHYQDIEAGKINISILMLLQLADLFEVSLDYLVGRNGQR